MNLVADSFGWLLEPANWTGNNSIPLRVGQHLLITAAAVIAAMIVAIPTGLLFGHLRRGSGFIGAVTGAARAIPTLGLLTLFGLALGIGVTAPLLALIVLGIPSLLAGAYAGVQSIDPATSGAAQAMGLSPAQVILRVELPLASPVIIGGIRASVLQVVATATLAAYTADVGLGRYLFAGLKSRDYPEMLGGAMLVAALALLLELSLGAFQRFATTRIADPAQDTTTQKNNRSRITGESTHVPSP